jgi:DNA-directed RNA polymerase subunit L
MNHPILLQIIENSNNRSKNDIRLMKKINIKELRGALQNVNNTPLSGVNYWLKSDTTSGKYEYMFIDKYPSSYYYGYFTKLFIPSKTNQEIGEEMTEFIESLLENKMGFLLGYGASGSGKTSSLIYFNKAKTNGCLLELCKILAQQHNYKKLSLKVKQFYLCDNTDSQDNEICKSKDTRIPDQKETEVFQFEFDGNFWQLKQGKKIVDLFDHPYFKYRLETKDENENPYINVFKDDNTLGNFLVYLIDQDRYVKATTNNPQSSRSHSLCFITFENTDKSKENIKLVIGDLAGVENTFSDKIVSIEKIMNIKRDNTNTNYYDK